MKNYLVAYSCHYYHQYAEVKDDYSINSKIFKFNDFPSKSICLTALSEIHPEAELVVIAITEVPTGWEGK
jgi:hypothetical protein